MVVKKEGLYEGYYKSNMGIIRDNYLKKNFDWLHCIDGFERLGKSTLAIQTCLEIDPTFDLNRICFSPKQYLNAVENAKKGQAILYDEAGTGLFSRQAMDAVNIVINKVLMTVGAKNIFHCMVLPNFFALDRNVAQYRVTSLAHIYRRGHFQFYSRKRLQIIAEKRSFYVQRPNFVGRWGDYNPFKKEYERLKQKYLKAYFDSERLPDRIGVQGLESISKKVLKNVADYSNEWRGQQKIDAGLIMHDFQVNKDNANRIKKLVERSIKAKDSK